MHRDRSSDGVATLERELLTRLGLGPDASAEQIAATHAALVAFLAGAPDEARGWARAQAAAADEALAMLSDPGALAREAGARAPKPAPPPPPKPAAKMRARGRPAPVSGEDLLDDLIAEVTPSAHRDQVSRPPARPASAPRRPGLSRRLLVPTLLVTGVAVVFAVMVLADSSIPSAPGPAASSEVAALDETVVSSLMSRVKADPNDVEALMGLADAFFQAGQYEAAAGWLTRLVDLEPENVRALLALGAAEFNSGSVDEAERSWVTVVELDPDNVEAHYDLGFLYLQREPPDLEGMRREWAKVVALAPGSQLATSVQAHLAAVTSPVASASAVASVAPSEDAR